MITDVRQLEGDIRDLEGLEVTAQKSKGWWMAAVVVRSNTSLGKCIVNGRADRTFMGAVTKAVEAAKAHLKANPALQA